MIAVSDTSPIKGLIAIRKSYILKELFEQIIVPSAVEYELRRINFFKNEVKQFFSESWIEVAPCRTQTLLSELRKFLDEGESEAICIAKEITGIRSDGRNWNFGFGKRKKNYTESKASTGRIKKRYRLLD